MTTRQQLKQWFSNLKKPNQNQFWEWIDSFVHKEDKIPMQHIEGLDAALQDTASDTQFQSHLTDAEAHQALFAQKVDKEDGKGLSANDYSDEEKQKVHDTADKVIVSGSVTGDVNKILTLTYSDSTTLKIPFKDLGIENVADIMLNSLNFNHETGVLTGLRSDGQQLTVNLDGRYSLIGHTHSYNDLEDLPTLLDEAPNDGKEYLRSNKTWKAFTGWQFKELGLENLNDIKTAGFYGKYNSSEATTARNYPYDPIRGGHLLVLPMTTNAGTLTVFQVYFAAGTQNSGDYTNNARIFMRAFVNNSHWLPWREFDGGKIHHLTAATQNLANAFHNKFPSDGSTFVISKATTITVTNSVQLVKYVKNTSENLTFSPASGVDIIGDKVVTAPVGTLVHLICNGTTAFVSYDKNTNTDNFIQKDSSNNLLLANGHSLSRDAYHWRNPARKNFLWTDGTEIAPADVFMHHDHTKNIPIEEIDQFWADRDSGIYSLNHGNSFSEILLNFNMKRGSTSALQIRSSYQEHAHIAVRKFIDNNRATGWKFLAFTDDVVSKGESQSGAEWTAPPVIFTSTVFLTGSGNKTINLHQMQDQSILSFKKCYNGGTVTFTCAGKQIVMRGATAFNGADGSNAVVSIVGNKCYIDINNY